MSESDTHLKKSSREQARKYREQKEAQERGRRTKQEILNRCRGAIEALGQSIYAMRCALDPFRVPPTDEELEEHYSMVTPLLAEALVLLRETNLLSKLEQLDEPATLAHYRQQGYDPQETETAYAHAKQMIEADAADRQRLTGLVRDAVEEPGLRKAWDWVSILLCGLIGQQRLVWKQKPGEHKGRPAAPVTSEGKEVTESCGQRQLEPAARKAYLAFAYAESKAGKKLQDHEAYELLREEGIPDDHGDPGELADYRLPAFATWARQLRIARLALNEQKYSRRAGRHAGKSIVKGSEIEYLHGDDG